MAGLPDSYEGTLTAYWNQLPDEIRQLLAIASLHGLLVEVGSVRNGYQAAFDVNELVVEHFLAQARTPHSWLADVDDFLDRFTDGALLGIASMNQERVGRSVVPTARRAMIDDLRTRRADTPAWTALNADARRFSQVLLLRGRGGHRGCRNAHRAEEPGGCGCGGRAGRAD